MLARIAPRNCPSRARRTVPASHCFRCAALSDFVRACSASHATTWTILLPIRHSGGTEPRGSSKPEPPAPPRTAIASRVRRPSVGLAGFFPRSAARRARFRARARARE